MRAGTTVRDAIAKSSCVRAAIGAISIASTVVRNALEMSRFAVPERAIKTPRRVGKTTPNANVVSVLDNAM